MSKPKKVCVLGSGNWASTIARIVGNNVKHHDYLHSMVTMYVYEEIVNGRNLSDVINDIHENIKYLPGHKLPENVLAITDVIEAAKDADALIFVIPQEYTRKVCSTLVGKIKPTACALSLAKGFDTADDGGIELISCVIHKILRINVSVLMGANMAGEVAAGQFTEAVLGCANKQIAPLWTDILSTDTFKVVITEDKTAVEVYGGLKNVIALGAGLVDGLELGDNSKAVFIRLGIMEMIKFVDVFYPGAKLSTFFESCGIADLVSSCYGGRNRRFGEFFVKTGKDILMLEREYLNGQKLQGSLTAEKVNNMLMQRSMDFRFPIMTAVHLICKGELRPDQLLEAMKAHPETTLNLHNTAF